VQDVITTKAFAFLKKNPKNLLAEPLLREIEAALLVGYEVPNSSCLQRMQIKGIFQKVGRMDYYG